MTRRVAVRALAFVSIAAATLRCTDGGTAPKRALDNSIGVIVSSVLPPGWGSGPAAPSSSVLPPPSVVFVSLAPGSVPGGVAATITNHAKGVAVTTQVETGGFDPVAIGATTGDTLVVEVRTASSSTAIRAYLVIAARRPPRIVRTHPPSGGRDVPLNSKMVVVFSEPIDPATLSLGIALRLDTVPVSGSVGFADTAHVKAAFQPADQLAPLTTYQLSITQAIRDVNGLGLDSAAVVTFTTRPAGGIIAFVSDRNGTQDLYVMNGDGSNVRQLRTNVATPRMPAWSPDGTKIAFVSSDSPLPGGYPNGRIYIINADGSGLKLLPVEGADPTWSTDGTKILFAQGGQPSSLYEVPADGSQSPVLKGTGFGNALSWSPDRSTVAFDWYWETSSWRPADRQCLLCDGYTGVYRRAGADTAMHRLTDSTADLYSVGAAAWSPDGQRIAFWNEALGIAVTRSDGSDVPAAIIPDRGNVSWWGATERIAWSPDGNYVAAVVNFVSGWPGDPQIWRVPATGGVPRVIADRAWDPAWSR